MYEGNTLLSVGSIPTGKIIASVSLIKASTSIKKCFSQSCVFHPKCSGFGMNESMERVRITLLNVTYRRHTYNRYLGTCVGWNWSYSDVTKAAGACKLRKTEPGYLNLHGAFSMFSDLSGFIHVDFSYLYWQKLWNGKLNFVFVPLTLEN
jgi:hypothetical protein